MVEEAKRVVNRGRYLLIAVLIGLSTGAGFIGGYIGAYSRLNNASPQTQKEVVSSESDLISNIAETVGPSVVSVNVTSQTQAQTRSGYSRMRERTSAGTGFVVGNNIVVTNRHVVPVGTSKVSIVLSDGTELDNVEVIGRTNQTDSLDVAFLKVNDTKGKELKAVTLGDSSKMRVGDKVVAIGNALGQFQNTVTSGIISGYGRDVEAGDETGQSQESLQDLFQTDAAINQGNSGGPLVNINGEVIGINTAVAGDAQNIGFSIPINDVSGMIKGVLATGKLQRPFLGVRYISITDDYASENNLPVKRGAYIPEAAAGEAPSIIAGSPAEVAGLQPKDIIIKVDNTDINENNSLSTVLARFTVGQKVTLTILRDGKQQTVDVMLGDAPQS